MNRITNKEKLLEASESLMLSKGYSGTRVDEICELAGVSKGSFYHFFPSKEELGLATLNQAYDRGIALLMAGPYMELEEPVERALGFLDHAESVAEQIWSRGCLIGNFATELAESSPRIHREVSRLLRQLTAGLARLFAPALDRAGQIGARELAEEFLATVEGSVILARAHSDPSMISDGVRRFRRSLLGATQGVEALFPIH